MSKWLMEKWFKRGATKREETPDPEPLAIPAGIRRPLTIQEQIARHMSVANRYAEMHGMETFEEAEDFDVGEDMDPSSPWETDFDHVSGREMYKAEKQMLDKDRATFDQYVRQEKAKKKPKKKAEEKPEA